MRRLVPFTVLALAAAVGLSFVQVPVVAAADGFSEVGSTTYALQPSKGRLAVTVSLKITNNTPDTSEPYSCTKYRQDWFWGQVPYQDTCYRVTHWYRNEASVWVESGAGKVKATSGGRKLAVSTSRPTGSYRVETITFPKLFYGKTRTLTISYALKGGGPRSTNPTRTMRAYASFCVIANGADRGSVTVKLPSGFNVDTSGESMRSKVDGGTRVFTSGTVKDTTRWYSCLSGTNENGYTSDQMTAPDGRSVRLLSWPEDPQWTRGVRDEVSGGLPELRRLIGSDMAGTEALIVKEASTGTEYAGFYDRKTNTITVGEDYTQPSLVAHELAHVWFNGAAFAETWMSEGYAEWAGRTASGDLAACKAPPAAASSMTLSTWKYLDPRSTDEQRRAVAAQYDAACYIVTSVAAAAGVDRMTAVTAALLTRRDPYATDPSVKRATRIATWRDWLDAVDELALRPAGVSEDLASQLLLDYGIATDPALLAKRAAARRAYQELLATVTDWTVPPVVRQPLAEWHFGDAQSAIAAAGTTWELTGETDATLDGVDAREGPAAAAWESAGSVADLEAAAEIAQRQLDAATDVAGVEDLLAQRLDMVEQVGMLGTVLPSLDQAVAAVKAGDTEGAASVTLSVRTMLGGLRAQGEQRIALGVGIGILLLALVVVLMAWRIQVSSRRRRSARLALAAASPVAGTAGVADTAGTAGVAAASPAAGTAAGPTAGPAVMGRMAPSTDDGTQTEVVLEGVLGPVPAWASPSIDDSPTIALSAAPMAPMPISADVPAPRGPLLPPPPPSA